MSRILLLLLFLLWMTATSDPVATTHPPDDLASGVVLFLSFYALLVVAMALWGRRVARSLTSRHSHKTLARFHNMVLLARVVVPAWFALGLFGLGWTWVVQETLRIGQLGPLKLPGLLFGTLPPLLAWAGLWWAQYPIDRALKEQNVLHHVNEGLPVHAPPTLGAYLASNLRQQLLFTLVPVLMIVLLRDLVSLVVFEWPAARSGPRYHTPPIDAWRELAELFMFLGSAGVVFIFAPEILRRVLKTSPLPEGPLRRRLEAISRRAGMRYRDILVWHTHYNLGNAAVMGIVPHMRYVLLSDLLLERMDDEQIEAVFAHEVGHVVHRHMIWYVIFFLTVMFGSFAPATIAADWIEGFELPAKVLKPLSLVAFAAGFFLIFGYLSRRFERQADVYAARVMEAGRGAGAAVLVSGPTPITTSGGPSRPAGPGGPRSHVGPYGAQVFASALHRVAHINNIPVSPRARPRTGLMRRIGHALGSLVDLAHDWLHGSIPHRMAYLQGLSTDPARTGRFDRVMTRLYCTLLFLLFASLAWALLGLGESL